ncbi:hypothetical protein FIBSPDRAFT_892859 [Athelia psychrophila]|uniref:Uncharacterized protein n=1 Tax=Athelia psychrophila TaxID=1759441 RepID=A0A166HVC0_9AGAM|nr:hypothetical protein FIBSPDRAFT_892859 [Fibularhizoctonia sp. CBS 109695]
MRLPTPPQAGVRERERALREKPYKASTPIQIPTRPRSILAPVCSPENRPLSPDLIFDMSPIEPSSIDSHFPADYRSAPHPFLHRALKRKPSSSSASLPNICHDSEPDHFAPLHSPDSYFDPSQYMSSRNRRLSFNTDQSESPVKRSYFTSAFADDADTENSSESTNSLAQSCIHSTGAGGRTRRLSVTGRFSALASPASVRRRRAISPPPPSLLQNSDESVVTKQGDVIVTTSANGFSSGDSYVGPVHDVGFEKHLMRRTEDEKRGGRSRRGRAASVVTSTFTVVVESYR